MFDLNGDRFQLCKDKETVPFTSDFWTDDEIEMYYTTLKEDEIEELDF